MIDKYVALVETLSEGENRKNVEKNLLQCRFVQHEFIFNESSSIYRFCDSSGIKPSLSGINFDTNFLFIYILKINVLLMILKYRHKRTGKPRY
jgi:hypothetical protein